MLSHLFENCDAVIDVYAPENTRDIAAVDSALIRSARGAYMPAFQRIITHEVPWVSCQFPTPALAQDAGLPTAEFADLLFAACLLDWSEQRSRMERHAELFDAAESVRITGDRTDLNLHIAGRRVKIDAGGTNMPGGEFFCSPVEDSAEGEILFAEFPCVYDGRELSGVRLRFNDGRIVDADAESGEQFLLEILDSDAGARRIGELGVGCNPGITRYMKNILFDEKIDGTIHIALGHGFPDSAARMSRPSIGILSKSCATEAESHLTAESYKRTAAGSRSRSRSALMKSPASALGRACSAEHGAPHQLRDPGGAGCKNSIVLLCRVRIRG